MEKEVKKEISKLIRDGKPKLEKDIQLQMAIQQGYVPSQCNLPGELVMALINSGKDPCDGCNVDRAKCGSCH